jgi:transposase
LVGDWSWSEHAVCVVDVSGLVVERLTVKHSGPGLGRLVSVLHRHRVLGVASNAVTDPWSRRCWRPT